MSVLSVSFVFPAAHVPHCSSSSSPASLSYPGSHRHAIASVLAVVKVWEFAVHCVHGPSTLLGLKLRVSQAVQTPVGRRS